MFPKTPDCEKESPFCDCGSGSIFALRETLAKAGSIEKM